MSSTSEASVQGVRFGVEGECSGVCPAGPRAPRGLELGPPQGTPTALQDKDLDFEFEEEGGEVGWTMYPGCEGRPSSPVEEVATLGFAPLLTVDSAAIVQKLTSWQALNTRRFWSPESCAAELSTIWTEASPSGGGTMAPSFVEAQQASATSFLHPSGPQEGQAWGNSKKDTKTRMMVSGGDQEAFSNLASSDEFGEIQLMKLPMQRPRPPFLYMHGGEFSSGDPNTRATQPPGISQPRSPEPCGDQEPIVCSPVPEKHQQAPGAWDYPQRVVLPKEIDDIKEQLVVMQSLTDKFQAL